MKNQELIMEYRKLDRDCALFHKHINGFDEEDTKKMFIPDQKTMSEAWDTWKNLKHRVEALEEPDDVFKMVKHHFQDFMDSLEYSLEGVENHPEWHFMGFNWLIDNASRLSRKTDEEKCSRLVSRLVLLYDNHEELFKLIKEKSDEKKLCEVAASLHSECLSVESEKKKLAEKFPGFTYEQINRLEDAMTRHCTMLADMADVLSQNKSDKIVPAKDDLSKTVKMDTEEYRTLLKKKLGVSLDELLKWHKDEIEKTRAEVFSIAAKLDITEPAPKTMQEVSNILRKYEGPCDSAEEMLSRANEYLKRTRAIAHEFVTLPDDEFCRCAPIGECCKDSYPWGGYEGGDFSIRPFRGQMFLNQYNYKNITDGWIKLNSLHEAYPGHHVQYVKAAISETPETVKMGSKQVPILEGTCLRTERAFEFTFGEDPFFPLFVAYRRHHASVRIYVDLMMFYYGATLEDVVKIYEEELGFDRVTARSQVQAHQNEPGYFTCYYYGMKKIIQWEKEYGFNKKDYTELLFSAGYISIDRLEELIKLAPEDRERYFHDFCSLLKEDFKHEA